MRVRAIWRDLCRSLRGAVALWRHFRSHDSVDVALGLLEAASPTASVGRSYRYTIRVANVREKSCALNVAFQVAPMTMELQLAPPVVRFRTHCIVPPCSATVIECQYDWHTTAVFMLDHKSFPPDEFWQGELKTPQRYVVSAILLDLTGRCLDQLDVYQELQG